MNWDLQVSQKGLCARPELQGYSQAFKYLWRVHLQSCARRDIPNEITPAEYMDLITRNCTYCGIEPSNVTKSRGLLEQMTYNGVDRIDNTKGYVISNLTTACKRCNAMKSSFSVSEFVDHVKRIAEFNTLATNL